MGAKGAVEIIFRGKNVEQETENYQHEFGNPLKAAERGHIDDIIAPDTTRQRIIEDLKVLENKKNSRKFRKHGCMPI